MNIETVKQIPDGSYLVNGSLSVPIKNRHYQEVQDWIDAGGILEPAFTDAELIEILKASIVAKTQTRLDDFARTRNYDGILSAASYATSTNIEFAKEGQYCVEARDLTWAKLYEIMNDVETGARSAPSSFEDIEPELPVLTWA